MMNNFNSESYENIKSNLILLAYCFVAFVVVPVGVSLIYFNAGVMDEFKAFGCFVSLQFLSVFITPKIMNLVAMYKELKNNKLTRG